MKGLGSGSSKTEWIRNAFPPPAGPATHTSMLELKARFTLALIFTTWPTLGRGNQEVSLPEGTRKRTGASDTQHLRDGGGGNWQEHRRLPEHIHICHVPKPADMSTHSTSEVPGGDIRASRSVLCVLIPPLAHNVQGLRDLILPTVPSLRQLPYLHSVQSSPSNIPPRV